MTAVHWAILEAKGPVLQFNQPVLPNGSVASMPVVVNLFGTPERVAAGLGITLDRLDDLGNFLAALKSPTPPDRFAPDVTRASGCSIVRQTLP